MTGIGFCSFKRARYHVLIIAHMFGRTSAGALFDNCPSLVVNVDIEMPVAKLDNTTYGMILAECRANRLDDVLPSHAKDLFHETVCWRQPQHCAET